MTVTYGAIGVRSNKAAASTTDTLTPALPAGSGPGLLVVFTYASTGTATITSNNGLANTRQNGRVAILEKVVSDLSLETAPTITFASITAAELISARCMWFPGGAASQDWNDATGGSGDTTLTPATLTTTDAASVGVVVAVQPNDKTSSTFTANGWSEREYGWTTTGTDGTFYIATQDGLATGAQTMPSWAWSGGLGWGSISFSVPPTTGGTTDGVGAASATGSATGTGISTAASAAGASGVAAASASGSSVASASGAASGSASAAAVGEVAGSVAGGAGSSSGVATTSGIGAAIAASIGAASATAGVSAVGAATASSIGTTAGAASASAAGVSTARASGSASGLGSVSGQTGSSAVEAGAGVADGVAAASGVAGSVGAAVGASSGSSASASVGVGIASGVGSASGAADAAAVGIHVAGSAGAASGSAAGQGTGSAVGAADGAATGLAAVLSIGGSVAAAIAVASSGSSAWGVSFAGNIRFPTIIRPGAQQRQTTVRAANSAQSRRENTQHARVRRT